MFFTTNRAYAEKFGSRWVILSAKYGFIRPDFQIPGPYNVSFKDPATKPVESHRIKLGAFHILHAVYAYVAYSPLWLNQPTIYWSVTWSRVSPTALYRSFRTRAATRRSSPLNFDHNSSIGS